MMSRILQIKLDQPTKVLLALKARVFSVLELVRYVYIYPRSLIRWRRNLLLGKNDEVDIPYLL